ncbi:hypothetical protein Pan3_48 [Pseudanabaena phage Pan3]|nr:hypothetical protein Pan3_48 [Pseudanabaena phage Pan3]
MRLAMLAGAALMLAGCESAWERATRADGTAESADINARTALAEIRALQSELADLRDQHEQTQRRLDNLVEITNRNADVLNRGRDSARELDDWQNRYIQNLDARLQARGL